MKCISAEWAKLKIQRVCFCLVLDEEIEKALTDAIDETQAEDVKKNVYGKWILKRKDYVGADGFTHNLYECDMCGRQIVGGLENFCPTCGADMRSKAEDIEECLRQKKERNRSKGETG